VTARITIGLAQDHRIVRDGVRLLFEAEPDFVVVGEAADGLEVMPLVQRLKPQVLVVDLMMPGLSGLEVSGAVSRLEPQTRVVILSLSQEDIFVLEALRNGAAGYVSRNGGSDDLVRAVREVAAGRHFLSPPLSEVVIRAYLGGTSSAGDGYGALTRREREVLRLVAEGLSAREIARRLGMSPRTAETHRSHVMHKLGLHNRTELIRFAIRRQIVSPALGQQTA
jgi:two-component system, NarL family, response regulator NreC